MSKVPKFQFEEHPPAKVAKPAKLHPVEPTQNGPEITPATCEACPWYELNPWTHSAPWRRRKLGRATWGRSPQSGPGQTPYREG
jgi:hypothetical protein